MADAHANFATSLVATAPSPAASGTSLVVTGGEGTRFPATPFNAVVCPAGANATPANAEVIRVTTRSTDTLTITRATESSSARTVIVGDRIYAGPTAKSLTDVEKAVGLESATDQTKVSALTELTTPAAADEFVVVDKSDTTMAASGTDKRIRHDILIPWVTPHGLGFPTTDLNITSVTGSVNQWYACRVIVMAAVSVGGIRYRVGTTSNGNVRASLWDILGGTLLADRTTNAAQGAANNNQLIAFDSAYAAMPGIYVALVWFSSASATFMANRILTSTQNGTQSGGTPTSAIGVGSVENAFRPVMATY